MGWALLVQYDWCPPKRRRHKHKGRTPCEDGGRKGGDASTSQGMPSIAGHHQKPGERHGTDSPSETSEGTHSADTLIPDF